MHALDPRTGQRLGRKEPEASQDPSGWRVAYDLATGIQVLLDAEGRARGRLDPKVVHAFGPPWVQDPTGGSAVIGAAGRLAFVELVNAV